MSYVLLFIALNGVPTYLGTYQSSASCQGAIRSIYEAKLSTPQVPITPEIKQIVDNQLKFQREYRCIPT